VADSVSATSIAESVLQLVGRDDLVAQPWAAIDVFVSIDDDELGPITGVL
jgi:hypothetical protein